jgi:uncharacterized protein YecT (DUF1311 family)
MPYPVRLLVLLAAVVATVDPGGAFAAEGLAQRVLSQPIQKPPADCEAASNRIVLELCAFARFRAADTELNKVFRTITTDTNRDDKNKKLLQEAQRQWLRYRDLTCDWQSDNVRGGTAATLYAINCLAEVTEAQAKYLDNASAP